MTFPLIDFLLWLWLGVRDGALSYDGLARDGAITLGTDTGLTLTLSDTGIAVTPPDGGTPEEIPTRMVERILLRVTLYRLARRERRVRRSHFTRITRGIIAATPPVEAPSAPATPASLPSPPSDTATA